jgi:HTH-type transcriptional regulator / antitoxin HipB
LVFSRDYMVDLESGHGILYPNRLFRVLHTLGITVTLTYGDAAEFDRISISAA